MAALTGLSRVTVRKAVQTLVAGRAAGAAARVGDLRRAAGRAGRAGAVAAHLLLRGHGAARQGRALGLAVAGGACAVARGDDGARARPRTTGWRGSSGCGSPTRCRWRSSGRRSRPRSCPIRRRSRPRSTRCWPSAACGRCGRCSGSRRRTSGRRDAGLLEVPVGRGGAADRADLLPALGAGRRVHPVALSGRRLRLRGRAADPGRRRKDGMTEARP